MAYAGPSAELAKLLERRRRIIETCVASRPAGGRGSSGGLTNSASALGAATAAADLPGSPKSPETTPEPAWASVRQLSRAPAPPPSWNKPAAPRLLSHSSSGPPLTKPPQQQKPAHPLLDAERARSAAAAPQVSQQERVEALRANAEKLHSNAALVRQQAADAAVQMGRARRPKQRGGQAPPPSQAQLHPPPLCHPQLPTAPAPPPPAESSEALQAGREPASTASEDVRRFAQELEHALALVKEQQSESDSPTLARQQEADRLRAERDAAERNAQDLRRFVCEQQAELAALRGQLDLVAEQPKIGSFVGEPAPSDRDADDLRRCVFEQQTELANLRSQLEHMVLAGQQKTESLRGEQDATKKDADDLRRCVYDQQAELALMRSQLEYMALAGQQKAETAWAERDAAEKTATELRQCVSELQAEVGRLQGEVTQLQERSPETELVPVEATKEVIHQGRSSSVGSISMASALGSCPGSGSALSGGLAGTASASAAPPPGSAVSTGLSESLAPVPSENSYRARPNAATGGGGCGGGAAAAAEDLRRAIGSVAALLGEAQRELAALADEDDDEDDNGVPEDSSRSRRDVSALRTGLDAAGMAARLGLLHALSPDEGESRRAVQNHRTPAEAQREAFLLVRKDQADALREVLESLDADVNWRAWKDHAGRSLVVYARQLRSTQVQEFLEIASLPSMSPRSLKKAQQLSRVTPPRLDLVRPRRKYSDLERAGVDDTPSSLPQLVAARSPEASTTFGGSSKSQASSAAPESDRAFRFPGEDARAPALPEPLRLLLPPRLQPGSTRSSRGLRELSPSPKRPGAPPPRALAAPKTAAIAAATAAASLCATSAAHIAKDQETIKKMSCFRAVTQDNAEALVELLRNVPVEVWARWQNKAGRDLVGLAQERGAANSCDVLSRLSGGAHHRRRAMLRRGEVVWVIEPGEMHPRGATVLEDAPDGAQDVLLEFWNEDLPAVRVQRGLVVSKAYN